MDLGGSRRFRDVGPSGGGGDRKGAGGGEAGFEGGGKWIARAGATSIGPEGLAQGGTEAEGPRSWEKISLGFAICCGDFICSDGLTGDWSREGVVNGI